VEKSGLISGKTVTFGMSTIEVNWKGPNIVLFIIYACDVGTVVNFTNVYNFQAKCHLIYQA
jgi:hypothetical protein